MKNSIVILYTAILGGDVAACRPSCASTFYDTLKAQHRQGYAESFMQ